MSPMIRLRCTKCHRIFEHWTTNRLQNKGKQRKKFCDDCLRKKNNLRSKNERKKCRG